MEWLKEDNVDLVTAYPTLTGNVSLKNPNLIGYSVLKVNLVGRYFYQFEEYYDSLSPDRKSLLRRAILSEKDLDVYIKTTREDLKDASTPGPIYRTIVGYLDRIESFINRLRREESS